MTTGVGIGVMCPEVKECQPPLNAGRGKEGFSPRDFGGTASLPTYCLQIFRFQDCEGIIFCCLF